MCMTALGEKYLERTIIQALERTSTSMECTIRDKGIGEALEYRQLINN